MIPAAFFFLLGLPVGLGIDYVSARYADRQISFTSAAITSLIAGMVTLTASCILPAGQISILFLTISFGWLLLTLANIDLRTFLLPDILNALVFALGIFMVALYRADSWMWHMAGAIAGYALLWGIETAYRHYRGIDALGRGDAKLLAAIGMWTGLLGLPPVLLIASLCGLGAALVTSLIRKQSISGATAIAFGPWIALGGYTVWLAQFYLS